MKIHDTEICARAEALAPAWAERASDAERARQIPRATIEELHDSQLLHILTPKRYGGLELDWPTLVESARIAARACASTGWTISVVGGHVATVARLPKACQDEIFGSGPRQLISTATAPSTGTIRSEEGGFRLQGSWRFSSGIDHASWVVVTGHALDGANARSRDMYKIAIPAGKVRIEDNWHVAGMRGTGSKDIAFDDVFVPSEWTLAREACFGEHPAGASAHPGAYIYDVPFHPYCTSWIIGPILGCAEGAYEDFIALTRRRNTGPGGATPAPACLAERLSESAAELSCAGLLYTDIASTLHFAGVLRRPLATQEVLKLKRDGAYLVQLCVSAVQRLVRQLGSSGIFDGHPVQRHWRDLQVMASHMDINRDTAWNAYGTHVLSTAPEPSDLPTA